MFKMKVDELKMNQRRESILPLFFQTNYISSMKVIPHDTFPNEVKSSFVIEYKPSMIKVLVESVTTNGEVVTVPLTELCKLEVSKEKTILYCRNLESDD